MKSQRPWASLLGLGIAAVAVLGGSVACVGGGGGLSEGMTTWESAGNSREGATSSLEGATNSREPAPPSTERAGSSSEAAPGAQGGAGAGGSFSCSGTFACQERGDDDVDTIVLANVNGNCVIAGSDSAGIVFESNGTLSSKGKPIGTWQATPTGFTATADDETILCTRVTGNPSAGSDDPDDDAPKAVPPSAGSGGGMTPVVDAGVSSGG